MAGAIARHCSVEWLGGATDRSRPRLRFAVPGKARLILASSRTSGATEAIQTISTEPSRRLAVKNCSSIRARIAPVLAVFKIDSLDQLSRRLAVKNCNAMRAHRAPPSSIRLNDRRFAMKKKKATSFPTPTRSSLTALELRNA